MRLRSASVSVFELEEPICKRSHRKFFFPSKKTATSFDCHNVGVIVKTLFAAEKSYGLFIQFVRQLQNPIGKTIFFMNHVDCFAKLTPVCFVPTFFADLAQISFQLTFISQYKAFDQPAIIIL
jgi:hypothetical protein